MCQNNTYFKGNTPSAAGKIESIVKLVAIRSSAATLKEYLQTAQYSRIFVAINFVNTGQNDASDAPSCVIGDYVTYV